LRLFGQQSIIHATHRFATVVYDFPAVLDDLLNVGNRRAHQGAAFLCGSPMRGELVVSRGRRTIGPPFVRQAAERRLSQSASPGISMPPITDNP